MQTAATTSTSLEGSSSPSTSQQPQKPRFTYQGARHKIVISAQSSYSLISNVFEGSHPIGQFTVETSATHKATAYPPSYETEKQVIWMNNNQAIVLPIFCMNKVIIEQKNPLFVTILSCVMNVESCENIATDLFSIAKSLAEDPLPLDESTSLQIIQKFELLSDGTQQEVLIKLYWVMANIQFERRNFDLVDHFDQIFLSSTAKYKSQNTFKITFLEDNLEYIYRIFISKQNMTEIDLKRLIRAHQNSINSSNGQILDLAKRKNLFKRCCQFAEHYHRGASPDYSWSIHKNPFQRDISPDYSLSIFAEHYRRSISLNYSLIIDVIICAIQILSNPSAILEEDPEFNTRQIPLFDAHILKILNLLLEQTSRERGFDFIDESPLRFEVAKTILELSHTSTTTRTEVLINLVSLSSRDIQILLFKAYLTLFNIQEESKDFIATIESFKAISSMHQNFDSSLRHLFARELPEMFFKTGKIYYYYAQNENLWYLFNDAINALQKALATNSPSNNDSYEIIAQCHHLLGIIYQSKHNYARAIHHYKEAANALPDPKKTEKLKLFEQAERLGTYLTAMEQARKLIENIERTHRTELKLNPFDIGCLGASEDEDRRITGSIDTICRLIIENKLDKAIRKCEELLLYPVFPILNLDSSNQESDCRMPFNDDSMMNYYLGYEWVNYSVWQAIHKTMSKEAILEMIHINNFTFKQRRFNELPERGWQNPIKFVLHIYHLMIVSLFVKQQYEDALVKGQEALKLVAMINNPIQHIYFLSVISHCYLETDNDELVISYAQQAIKIDQAFETHDSSIHKEISITQYQETSRVYFTLERALIRMHKINEALEVADIRRARTLTKLLNYKACSIEETREPFNVEAMIELSKKLSVTFVSYSLSLYPTEFPRIHVWVISPSGTINHVELNAREFQNHFGQLKEFYDNVSEQTIIKTRSVSEVSTDHSSSSFYFDPSQPFEPQTSWSSTSLSPMISEISPCSSSSISLPDSSENFDFVSPSTDSKSTSSSIIEQTRAFKQSDKEMSLAKKAIIDAKLLTDCQFWYDILIRPIEAFLPRNSNETITIIPEGFLHQIPFAALHDRKNYLIEKHPISFAPSLKTLDLQHQLAMQRRENPPSGSLAIGNPFNDKIKNPDGKLFAPLEFAAKEAREVTELLGEKSSHLFLNKAATVEKFKQTAPNVRWIFAGCHGQDKCKPEDDRYSVFEGELILSPNEKSYPYDGRFSARDISELTLKAELVFLSACYSGTGNIQQEGVMGNVWSFLSAGALSTVSTYWPLPESEDTKEMVITFYRHILGKTEEGVKINKAQALRQATLYAMRKVGRENIKQWGAFFLTGLIDAEGREIGTPRTLSE